MSSKSNSPYENIRDKILRNSTNATKIKDGKKLWTTPTKEDTVDKAFLLAKLGLVHVGAAFIFGATLYSYEEATGEKAEELTHVAAGAVAMTSLSAYRHYMGLDKFTTARVFMAALGAGLLYHIIAKENLFQILSGESSKTRLASTYSVGYTTFPVRNIDKDNENNGLQI
ncbi:hypothetical protein FSP39_010909 [Pinctada imbricata]|uniref:Uncharacterized protein n=1 Tax=Pinctada imbricata TaxID=66713 RepID=A0AA88XKD5_PINIB|nr:hypothetical protein FSP39_010909 [Pinctada imbricata]